MITPRKIWPVALLLLLYACRNNPPAANRYVLFPGGNIGRADTTNIIQTKK